jgi:ZIP family zinc transporter/zinc and cadmium transporter
VASVVTASLASFTVTFLSGLGALYLRAHKSLVFATSAGALVGGAAFFLLPDALQLAEETARRLPVYFVWAAAGAGFALFYWLERDHHSDQSARLFGLGGGIGLAAHSFLDGVVIGQGVRAGGETALVLALAVLLHRLADGASTVGLMLGTAHNLRQTVAMLIVTALAPILGAVAQSFVELPTLTFALLLAFFSGMLLYLGVKRLVPEARRASLPGAPIGFFFLAGFAVAGVARLLSH